MKENEYGKHRTANERFYENGGVCPQTVLYEFASASPARTFVNPRIQKSAGALYESLRTTHYNQQIIRLKLTNNNLKYSTIWTFSI